MVDWAMLARTSDRKPRQLAAKRGTALTNSRDGQLQAWLHPEALPLAASTALASFFRSMLYTPRGRGEGAGSSGTARHQHPVSRMLPLSLSWSNPKLCCTGPPALGHTPSPEFVRWPTGFGILWLAGSEAQAWGRG